MDISASGRAARLKTHNWTRLRLGGPAAPLILLFLVVTFLVVLAGCTPTESGGSSTSTSGGTTVTSGGTSTSSSVTSTTLRPPTEARRLAPTTGTFSTCPDCHSLLDPPTVARPALTDAFGHESHLARGATCESCHIRPVHSQSGTRRPYHGYVLHVSRLRPHLERPAHLQPLPSAGFPPAAGLS